RCWPRPTPRSIAPSTRAATGYTPGPEPRGPPRRRPSATRGAPAPDRRTAGRPAPALLLSRRLRRDGQPDRAGPFGRDRIVAAHAVERIARAGRQARSIELDGRGLGSARRQRSHRRTD